MFKVLKAPIETKVGSAGTHGTLGENATALNLNLPALRRD